MGAFTLIVIVGMIVMFVMVANANKKRLSEARSSYHACLEALKAAPNNADLKQRTLALGREYSYLTRKSKHVTVFDEVALSNDISAACAGAGMVARPSQPAAASKRTVEQRLEALEQLHGRGLVTEDEYQAERRRILNEL